MDVHPKIRVLLVDDHPLFRDTSLPVLLVESHLGLEARPAHLGNLSRFTLISAICILSAFSGITVNAWNDTWPLPLY
jgi:hypothetical protein